MQNPGRAMRITVMRAAAAVAAAAAAAAVVVVAAAAAALAREADHMIVTKDPFPDQTESNLHRSLCSHFS